ncbi:MAG: hypothetical protein J7M38_06700 [Armatimonadetes bacterium]|nr:hypothetical protein [Armatimonadota bacterium]
MKELLRNKFVIFILALSMVVNAGTFMQEYIKPGSAEHWQVGLSFLLLSLIIYLWNRKEPDILKQFVLLVTIVNGVLALFLDIIIMFI